jgi:hypothetical protein
VSLNVPHDHIVEATALQNPEAVLATPLAAEAWRVKAGVRDRADEGRARVPRVLRPPPGASWPERA